MLVVRVQQLQPEEKSLVEEEALEFVVQEQFEMYLPNFVAVGKDVDPAVEYTLTVANSLVVLDFLGWTALAVALAALVAVDQQT